MKVFVTGARGFIGRALLDRYRAAGARVAGVDRRAEPEFSVVAGDVVDPEPWSELMRSADVVFHSAAMVSNTAPKDAIWQVNVLGTRRVVEAAARAGAGRLVHFSSIAAFGFDLPAEAAETHPVRPNGNPYVDSKIAAEQVVLQAHAAGEIECSIVRPADVYGPRSRPWTVLPVELLRARRFLLPARGRGVFSPVYIDNLIDGLVAVAERDAARGQVITIGDGTGLPAREFFGHYARMLGRTRVPALPTPLAIAAAGALGGLLRWRGRETEIGAETMRMLARNGGYSIAKARDLLDYEPRVDLAEGMRRTERWLADEGLLGDRNKPTGGGR